MTRKPKKSSDTGKVGKKSGSKDESQADDRTPEQRFGDSIRTSAHRETVEAFVVAFVLALLFRAFVAEAFVIPTGSMAPTLMGAHKDVDCQQCDHRFQIGASKERRGPYQDDTVVAGICPNCRFVNNLDLADDSNAATFNGDRILVSKFAYTLSEPERWDVIVFKFPGNPKQNYIKRLVGLPNETVSVMHGDVYAAPTEQPASETILRKPADKLLAMRHHVYDSDQQSDLLIKSSYPSRIQPWHENTSSPPTDSWTIDRSKEGLVAKVEPGDASRTHWLRYFHRWPTEAQWDSAANGGTLGNVDPYSSRLITDFYSYDCYITVPSRDVYDKTPSNGRWSGSPTFNPDYQSGGPLSQFRGDARFGERDLADDGLHWVGDLIVESDVTASGECKELTLELVEAGIQYQCRIDLENGNATLSILDGQQALEFSGPDGKKTATVTGSTAARSGDSFSVRYSNCDDQLLLWIDDSLVEFDGPTTFDAREFRSKDEAYPRYQDGVHPLDAAPLGIAVRGGAATIDRVKIDRDKYYVATDNSSFGIFDYDMNVLYQLAQQNVSFRDIQAVMARPDLWEQFPGWQTRRKVTFPLAEDQFFPMGDNSPESLDARCWAGTKLGHRLPDRFRDQAYMFADASYVPRDLLVGKALMVFWPHPWKSPVPFTPNFDRFRFIR
ncbi:Signal peptidase I [Stieleria maiorica]|uniref:Signal peptidase I n=1 Tax=Stieleria maiorica TaxID=2795974 RepID=A0A5B9MFN2_9BACT|nr:signal peptidase I [Stieleria maiorica]QEF99339.1 Signal peptidase I [Stieleria maiorica]